MHDWAQGKQKGKKKRKKTARVWSTYSIPCFDGVVYSDKAEINEAYTANCPK